MTSVRLLKIIFVILILVTLGELGYYVYIQVIKTPQTEKSTKVETTLISPTLAIENPTPTFPYTPPEQAYREKYLNYLRKEKADVLISAITTHKFKGKIVELDTKGGISAVNKFQYVVKIVIQGEKGSTRGFLYNEKDLQIAKLIKSVNGKEEAMSINDLKVGDNVIITEVVDAFMLICSKDECLIGLTIEKL